MYKSFKAGGNKFIKKIGILYICTGKYKVLWKKFFESCEKFFLKNCEKYYFVFTDSNKIDYENNINVLKIYQKQLVWPFPTLYRYKFFLSIENQLKEMDYLFFFNADAEFVDIVDEQMILPRESANEDIVVVQHAGFYSKKNYQFTYDRNPRSKAFVPFGRGKYYVCGGINGGKADAYLRMCHLIDKRIDQDYKKGIIALWHDESHLNKYIIRYKNYRILSPSFVHPTQKWWVIPFKPIIEIRDKTKYFDVNSIKTYNVIGQSSKFAKYINKAMKLLAHFSIFRTISNIGVTNKKIG